MPNVDLVFVQSVLQSFSIELFHYDGPEGFAIDDFQYSHNIFMVQVEDIGFL